MGKGRMKKKENKESRKKRRIKERIRGRVQNKRKERKGEDECDKKTKSLFLYAVCVSDDVRLNRLRKQNCRIKVDKTGYSVHGNLFCLGNGGVLRHFRKLRLMT